MFNFKRVFSKNRTITKTASRLFSNNQGPNMQGLARSINLSLLGIGTAGLGYMFYKSMAARNANAPHIPMQTSSLSGAQPMYYRSQTTIHNPLVQSRVQNALAYFGGGIGLTGLSVALFRHTAIAYMNPFLLFIPTIAALIGTMYFNYHTQTVPKHAVWASFCGLNGLALAPLINYAGMGIAFNALAATGVMMGLLGAYAYSTPTSDFLSWRGALSVGLCGLIGVNLVSLFWPSSLLTTISLYGGLMLFGGFTLYDTQKLLHNAQIRSSWDPINESLGIYLDALNIFTKLLIIFSNNKKK